MTGNPIKAVGLLQDRLGADRSFVFHINPYKPHIFWKVNSSRLWLIVQKSQNRKRHVFFCESICLCKFNSSPAKNERKRTINITFASWHVLLKNRVSDFWHVHLFFFNNRIKSKRQIISSSFEKIDGYSKTEKENKNRRHGFQGKLQYLTISWSNFSQINQSIIKVVPWRKSHLSYLSHFKT